MDGPSHTGVQYRHNTSYNQFQLNALHFLVCKTQQTCQPPVAKYAKSMTPMKSPTKKSSLANVTVNPEFTGNLLKTTPGKECCYCVYIGDKTFQC